MVAAMLAPRATTIHYYENIEGGHGGAADNDQSAFRWALVLDFLWKHTGG